MTDAPSASNRPGGVVTEDSAAEEFVNRHGATLRFDHSDHAWFRFDGFTWVKDQTELARNAAREIARELAAGQAEGARYALGRSSFAGGVERFARADRRVAVDGSVWDRDPFLLGTPGGTVDLRTGQLREADPADMIRNCTAVAPAETADCPMFLKFLDEVTGWDDDLVRFLKIWFGYCLTGDYREHSFVFIQGNGRNGKGVLLNTIRNIAGTYATTAAMDTFVSSKGDRHPADLAKLAGKRLVGASETDKGKSWDEARIKAMTGGDIIPAHFMHKDWFDVGPTFKITFIGNFTPDLKNVNPAIRSRLALLIFKRSFAAAPDTGLELRLRAEWPAILRWQIEGSLLWQAEGLVRPSVVVRSSEAYFHEQDTLNLWLENECVIERENRQMRETSRALWDSWVTFCKGRQKHPGRSNEWADGLRKRGVTPAKVEGNRGYAGIKLRDHRE